jgi:hypothetical protein
VSERERVREREGIKECKKRDVSEKEREREREREEKKMDIYKEKVEKKEKR